MRRVAVLIESSRAFGRGLLEGIARYSHEQGPWSIYFEPQGMGESSPEWLRHWHGDGILARVDNQAMADAIRATGVPVLDLRGTILDDRIPLVVGGDNARIAWLAFEHFRERGIPHFGFCGVPRGRNRFLEQREDDFRRLVEEAGHSCWTFTTARTRRAAADWEREQEQLADWLRQLPKPIGIMACHDDRGYQVLDACRRAGLAVPDQVAVVGVDNDLVLCGLADPPMSSIDPDAPRIGYEAAAWLDRLMNGESLPRGVIPIEPRGLVVRQSSDVLAIPDADLAAALRFIRDHACAGIRVDDVLQQTALSRSALERKFRHYLGRSPKAEILRVQIARASALLLESSLPLKEVARQSGFSTEKYFSDAFLRETGTRPGAFRRARRFRPPAFQAPPG